MHSTEMHITNHRRLARVERHLAPLPPTPSSLLPRPTHASSSISSLLDTLPSHVVLSPAVRSALLSHRPVVALESTIITHGMKFPENVQTAISVEAAATALHVTPATIAILDGRIHVGLTAPQLQRLGQLGLSCRKCSTRDFSLIISERGNGSTTVAATMHIAALCGIRVFATGGVGGVHRGVEATGDISADLEELSHTPVAVVCAGVKSILDIGRTLEYLETKGVPVVTLSSNPSAPFPAFFSADSGIKSPTVLPTPAACAAVIRHHRELGLRSGVLIANPIPAEFAAEGQRMEAATQRALHECTAQGIKGGEVTPFLLLRIAELTGGESLAANIQLIQNNVRAAALIATELHRMEDSQVQSTPPTLSASVSTAALSSLPSPPLTVVVCGAVNMDIMGSPTPGSRFLMGTSSPGSIARHLGGVGRNIAEALGRLEHWPVLIAAVGVDNEAEQVIRQCEEVGIRREGFTRLQGLPTSTYLAILDESNDRQSSDPKVPPRCSCLPCSPHR